MLLMLSLKNPVFLWWSFLLTAVLTNALLWWRERERWGGSDSSWSDFLRRTLHVSSMMRLSGIYVLGCAIRSVFPKADIERLVLFDHWFSSIFVGRVVATVAELAFALQWAIVLRELGSRRLSTVLIFLIGIAECSSWYAVITTHFMGHVVEESLWALSFTLIAIVLFGTGRHLMALGCGAYVAFMALVDVPMYFNRWFQQRAAGHRLMGFWEGMVDLNSRRVVSWSLNDWREEIPWLSLYFTVAVWVSIYLRRLVTPSRSAGDA